MDEVHKTILSNKLLRAINIIITATHGRKTTDQEMRRIVNTARVDYHYPDLDLNEDEYTQLFFEYNLYRSANKIEKSQERTDELKKSLLFSEIRINIGNASWSAVFTMFEQFARKKHITCTLSYSNKKELRILVAPKDEELLALASAELAIIGEEQTNLDPQVMEEKRQAQLEKETPAAPVSPAEGSSYSFRGAFGSVISPFGAGSARSKPPLTKAERKTECDKLLAAFADPAEHKRTKNQRAADAMRAVKQDKAHWFVMLEAMVDGWGEQTAISDYNGKITDESGHHTIEKHELFRRKLENMSYNGMTDADLPEMQLSILLDELVSRERVRQRMEYRSANAGIEKETREYFDKSHVMFHDRAYLTAEIADKLAKNKITREQANQQLAALENQMSTREIPEAAHLAEQNYTADAAFWKRQDRLEQLILRLSRDFSVNANKDIATDYVNTYFGGAKEKYDQLKNLVHNYPNYQEADGREQLKKLLIEMSTNGRTMQQVRQRENRQQSPQSV